MYVNEYADGDFDVDIWSAVRTRVLASVSFKHTTNNFDTELHFQKKNIIRDVTNKLLLAIVLGKRCE